MSDKPCNQCQHYDPILKGKGKPGRHGRCAVKSTYPALEQRGQVFPLGVKREAPGALAKPYIVMGSTVNVPCLLFRAKPLAPPAPAPRPSPLPVTRRKDR